MANIDPRDRWWSSVIRLSVDRLGTLFGFGALVPNLRANLTLFHGVFAPNNRHRAFMPFGCV